MHPLPTSTNVRPARIADLEALLALEQASFSGDRMSRRQYRYHLNNRNARVLVAVHADHLQGSALLLFRHGSRAARLYSLAVDAQARGHGIGRILLQACEHAARAHGCTHLRLEVRVDNHAAIALYMRAGFQCLRLRSGYYEDGADAQVLQRALVET